MPVVATKVLQITSAHGWYFDDSQGTGHLHDYEPVAVFALVEAMDVGDPGLGATTEIVSLKAEELDSMWIIGKETMYLNREIVHELKIRSRRDDEGE